MEFVSPGPRKTKKVFGKPKERKPPATTTPTATDSDRYQGVQSEADRGVPGQSRAAQRSDGRTHADAADHDGRKVSYGADRRPGLRQGWGPLRGHRFGQRRAQATGMVRQPPGQPDRYGRGGC